MTWTVILYIFSIMVISAGLSFALVLLLLHFQVISPQTGGERNQSTMLLILVGVELITCFIVVNLSGRMLLKYTNKFINRMNRLASGDFKVRMQTQGIAGRHPTIREVEGSFNNMAQELENTQILRKEFINNFSHEFKTPIVSIAGFTKLLKHGDLSEEQKKEYLDIIEEESLRLAAMATNVLNMTKVENQVILTEVTEFNLSEQIRSSILLLENAWTKKNLEFSLEFEEYQIHANEELLKQVWINLLDNAIKFSQEYGMIVVKIIEEDPVYKIAISNYGDEIPKDSREKIYEKFYQLDESHLSEGNGIGLAIVKKVLELHNGDIEVECRNGITTFIVTIPKVQG